MLSKESFIEQIGNCRSSYLFVQLVRDKLIKAGYIELFEKDEWKKDNFPKKFFVISKNGSIFAGNIGTLESAVFSCSRYGFPCYKIKPDHFLKNRNIESVKTYKCVSLSISKK